MKCFLYGQWDELHHKLVTGACKRVKRAIPEAVKRQIGQEMLDRNIGNKEMQTELLDRVDYGVLGGGNYSSCPTDNQMKECRRLAKNATRVCRGSLNDTHAVVRQLAKEFRDPSGLYHGFVFDFWWTPLSAMLTTGLLMDLFVKACQEIGESFQLHLDATGKCAASNFKKELRKAIFIAMRVFILESKTREIRFLGNAMRVFMDYKLGLLLCCYFFGIKC